MSYYFIAAYVVSSILFAYLGRNARLRFWGVLLAALILSPLVVGFALLFFGTTPTPKKTTDSVAASEAKPKAKLRS